MEKKTKEKDLGKAFKMNVDIKRNLVPLKGLLNGTITLYGKNRTVFEDKHFHEKLECDYV